jgi:tetratricopeptide (TPR) repeat protein
MRFHKGPSISVWLRNTSARTLEGFIKTFVLISFVSAYSGCASVEKLSGDETQEKAIEAAKSQAQQEFASIVIVHKNGELERAKQSYEAFLVRFPNNTAARINLAHIALQNENTAQAAQYISEALKIDPLEQQALTLAGVISREKGDFDVAESYYRQALAVNPDYLPAIRNLGILLDLYRGRLAEALELYERAQALETEPDPKLKDWIFDIKRRIGE